MVLGFIKKMFKREDSLPDIGVPLEGPSPTFNQTTGLEYQYTIPNPPQPTLPPQAFLTQNILPPQNPNELEIIKQQIIVLNTKLDLLNSKVDHLIQKIQMLENYLFYRR